MEDIRQINAPPSADERALEQTIRPKRLDDYTGQPQVCEQMEILSALRASGPKHWIMC